MDSEITAVVLTKNEEKNITDCLESLKWVDNLIIVDDFSSDKTIELAKKYSVKIYQRSLGLDFSMQRNFALSKVTTEWTFFVDADERISEELKNEIIGKLNFNNGFDGYKIKRTDVMWGKKIRYGEQGNTWITRLFRTKKGRYQGKIHEKVRVDGVIGKVNNEIIHYPHQSIKDFLKELNFYSTIRANELKEAGIKSNGFLILAYTMGKFIKNYFFLLGILDGVRGLILATIMSMHSFLSRGKLWLLWKKR